MHASFTRLWAVVLVAAGAAGCGSSHDSASAPPPAPCTAATATQVTGTIGMAGTAFLPSCAKVARGTTVTFTNGDVMAHTVTTNAGAPDGFDSGLLGQGAQFVHTFDTPGTIGIHCTVHPFMALTVIVQ